MDEDGVLYVAGDAADEASLLKAGIRRAKGLVAALATDTDNVFWFYRPGSWPRNLILLHGPVAKGPRTNCARPAPIR